MSRLVGWWWPALAGLATLVALVADRAAVAAVVAATVAVVAGSLTLVEVLAGRPKRAVEPAELFGPRPGGSREAFTGGVPGREDIVYALDLIERKFSRPDLPARRASEVAEIARRAPEQFRRYVADRLNELDRLS